MKQFRTASNNILTICIERPEDVLNVEEYTKSAKELASFLYDKTSNSYWKALKLAISETTGEL